MGKSAEILAGMIRICCVIALVMVGFAHAPVVAAPFGPVERAAYALPDGTLPVFCINDDANSKPIKMVSHGCEACRLAAAVILPAPTGIAGRAIALMATAAVLARPDGLVRRLYPPSSGPRAPPLALISV